MLPWFTVLWLNDIVTLVYIHNPFCLSFPLSSPPINFLSKKAAGHPLLGRSAQNGPLL